MRKMLVALVAALAVPLAARADQVSSPLGTTFTSTASPYYATARVGMYVPTSDDMDGFNNGVATELQVGRRFHTNFAAEGGIGWFSSSTDSIMGAKATLSAVPVTVTAKGILPFGKAEVYGLGGIGAYFASVEVKTSSGNFSDDDTGFGLHLGAGGQYAVSQNVSLALEGRYMIAQVNDVNLDGFMLNGGVAFHF